MYLPESSSGFPKLPVHAKRRSPSRERRSGDGLAADMTWLAFWPSFASELCFKVESAELNSHVMRATKATFCHFFDGSGGHGRLVEMAGGLTGF